MIKRKQLIYVVVSLVILTSLFFIMQQKNSYRLEKINRSDTLQIDIALLDYRKMASEDGSELYQNLLEQTSEIARQSNALLFKDEKKFIDTTLALTIIQEKAQTLDGFSDIASLQKTSNQLQRDKLYYQHLKENNETLPLEKQSFGRLLVSLLTMLGFVWFPLMSLVNARLVVEEKEHESLIKGQPRSLMKRLVQRFIRVFIAITGIFIGSTLYLSLLQLVNNQLFGDFGSTEVIKQQSFVITSVLGKIGYFVLYFALLYVVSFLLSITLNHLTKNSYVTVIIECLVYSFIWLVPAMMKVSILQWIGVLSPTLIIDGQLNGSTNQGIIVLVILIVGLFVISVGQQSFMGRKRHYD